jgi:hypothetical protein
MTSYAGWPSSGGGPENILAEKAFMTRWFVAPLLTATLMCGGSAAIHSAVAAPFQAAPAKSQATDVSSRRQIRHDRRYAERPGYPPYYYDRPTYYRPYPYASPVPFFLGFNFGPWW